jgi:hypothetical protein
LVFRALGTSGTARGAVAQVGFVLVPGAVTLHGRRVVPAMGYASPVSVQRVSDGRAVATGDFAVAADRVEPVLAALAAHGMTATAVHTHLLGERPRLYYVHFWADGPLAELVTGLRAVLDAARRRR